MPACNTKALDAEEAAAARLQPIHCHRWPGGQQANELGEAANKPGARGTFGCVKLRHS
jgi:hypothetical protein